MDFKWTYDQQEPFFIPHMHEPPNSSYLAVIHSDIGTQSAIAPLLDLSADYVCFYLGNDSNGDIDIETITSPMHIDLETKPDVTCYHPIFTDELIRSGIKQVDEAIMRMKEDDIKPVTSHVEAMDVNGLSTAHELQDWKYVQFTDNFGSTQCFAVNNSVQERKQPQLMNTPSKLLPPQQPSCSSQLYRLLNNSLHSELTLQSTVNLKEIQPRFASLIVKVDSNSEKKDARSNCLPDEVSVSDGTAVKILAEKMIEEIGSLDAMAKEPNEYQEEFRNLTHSTTIENAHSDKFGSELVPTCQSSPNQSKKRKAIDAVVRLPSNPKIALVANYVDIGPLCTASGIFSNVFDTMFLQESRMKLPAEDLTNGIMFEMHTRFTQVIKGARKNFARILSHVFDIELDWQNGSVVCRLFRKGIIPVISERIILAKGLTAPNTRRISQSSWKVKNENDAHQQIAQCDAPTTRRSSLSRWKNQNENDLHQQIAQFDAAVFVIPPDKPEAPKSLTRRIGNGRKVVKKELEYKSATSKRPTQGEQLLELQTRFDAFRRSQRKHDAAFLRHIFLIQRELESVKRSTSGFPQGRRRSIPNPSV